MYKTRSGRTVKAPDRYEPPIEKMIDDYDDDEYDDDDLDDTESIESDDQYESDDEVDENGNLKGFVESDDEESEAEQE